MIHLIVILAQLATAPQQALPTESFPLDSEREAVITLGLDGKPVQAVVRRFDGKPMTCETYFAWHRQYYTCTGNCGATYVTSGSEGSNSSRLAACEAAKATACSFATCQSGTYQYCSLQYSYSGWNGGTGSCTYGQIRDCPVADDCTVN
ncbi:MAG TPA: hypothetical protein VEO54_23060 [Thermoanaerobaculia bacterium]|nr:hypothetical protein [Thermoanaerobaculia bacterium]